MILWEGELAKILFTRCSSQLKLTRRQRIRAPEQELNTKTPVAPIDMTKDLCCPLLGLFGNEDRAPSPEQVNQHEAELKKHGSGKRAKSAFPRIVTGLFGLLRHDTRLYAPVLHVEPRWKRTGARGIRFQRKSPALFRGGASPFGWGRPS